MGTPTAPLGPPSPVAGADRRPAGGRGGPEEGGAEAALEVRIRGVVQGVGFRPFVHRLAAQHGLSGWVRNEAGSVRLVVEGRPPALQAFLARLTDQAPPLARIDEAATRELAPEGWRGFSVTPSMTAPVGRLPVSPDVALCAACARELADPGNRRYRYPFITCTDCGPRFTVIESMPYDRERSTMGPFVQCERCLAEYRDPRDRRYHSETNSCPACGPSVWLEPAGPESAPGGRSHLRGDAALVEAGRLLREGHIVAVRGLGGFHLAVDATDQDAVVRLRIRKGREAKPLAVMVASMAEARALVQLDDGAARMLTSAERPIVVLPVRDGAPLAPAVAPGLDAVGVMTAYTPLHLLLLEAAGRPLVMTSGNVTDEPIAIGNEEARRRLASVADAFLLHDREIVARYDDSVVRMVEGAPVFLRRARGYAPLPLPLPVAAERPILAVGPHLKNTFAVAQEDQAWVSPHVGDLEDVETLDHFRATLDHFRALFRLEPEAVVRDLHPGYLSTRLARESGLEELEPVQHHHAHVAAVQAEHGETGPIVGLAFDGTGYGADGCVWGAEFLHADLTDFRRVAHLRYVPLAGGERAVRAPWRTVLGWLSLEPGLTADLRWALEGVPPEEVEVARHQLRRDVNAPWASSMGRLFDAAAAVLGVRSVVGYEGQAAMELEALAGRRTGTLLPFPVRSVDGVRVLDPLPLLAALGEGRRRGTAPADAAASFHDTVAHTAARVAVELGADLGVSTVALSGGCFQNARLLATTRSLLLARGIGVLTPERLGPNDGSVAYGQAAVAAARLHGPRSTF